MDFVRFVLVGKTTVSWLPYVAVRIPHKSAFDDSAVESPAIGESFAIWRSHPDRELGFEGLAVRLDGETDWKIEQA